MDTKEIILPAPSDWIQTRLWGRNCIRFHIDKTFSILVNANRYTNELEWALLRRAKKILIGSCPRSPGMSLEDDVNETAETAMRESLRHIESVTNMYAAAGKALRAVCPKRPTPETPPHS